MLTEKDINDWRADPVTIELISLMQKHSDQRRAALKDTWMDNGGAIDLTDDIVKLNAYDEVLYNFKDASWSAVLELIGSVE